MVGFLETLTCQLNPNHLGIWAQCQQNQRLILDPMIIIGRYSPKSKNLATKRQGYKKSSFSVFYLKQTLIKARSSLTYLTHRKLRWSKQHQSQNGYRSHSEQCYQDLASSFHSPRHSNAELTELGERSNRVFVEMIC